jgi:hypothetical protein
MQPTTPVPGVPGAPAPAPGPTLWAPRLALALAALVWSLSCSFSDRGAVGFRAVGVEDVILGEESVIVLRESEGAKRELPIVIGAYEAQSIVMALHDLRMPRPNSHDLIKSLMAAIDARIDRVLITEVRDNVYFAELQVEQSGRRLPIDARPSDAIAVAVRTKTPIFAAEGLLRSRAGRALETEAPRATPDFELHVH